MAKYATGTASSTDDFFTKVETHILANGWSLLHSFANSSNNRDRVYVGGAIDSTGYAKPIVRLTYIEATQSHAFCARVYTDFDTSAGAGMNQGAGDPGINPTSMGLQGSSFSYWIRANKWAFALTANPVAAGNNPQNLYAGFLRRNLPTRFAGITKSTGAITSGQTVIPVANDMTGKLYVGQKILLINHNGNNASANKNRAAMKTISAITPGGSPSITISTTAGAAYDANTLIGENPLPLCIANFYGGSGIGATLHPLFLDGTRTDSTSQTAAVEYLMKDGNLSDDVPGVQNRFRWANLGVRDTTPNKAGHRGLLHHFHGCAPRVVGGFYSFTNLTDVVDDKVNTFLVVSGDNNGATLLGPR